MLTIFDRVAKTYDKFCKPDEVDSTVLMDGLRKAYKDHEKVDLTLIEDILVKSTLAGKNPEQLELELKRE